MSDNGWVARQGRHIRHSDPDCRHLDRARSIREATDAEAEAWPLCRTCTGQTERQSTGGGHLESLKAAARQGGETA